MNAIFTIVAKNYIGLAQVLEKSVKAHSDADFFIIVADEWNDPEGELPVLADNIWIARDHLGIKEDLWNEMAFKYSLIELCTAIKPFCFRHLFNKGNYSKIIFFDPDVYVFSSLNPLFDRLDQCSLMVTPHIKEMQILHKSDHPDYLFLVNGTFNLGFLGMRLTPESILMMDWWRERMIDQCFFDNDRGMATDQKWMNMLPAFFDDNSLCINRDGGLNVAPWNYHERRIINENGKLLVTSRSPGVFEKTPLCFVHYSGYDYQSLSGNKVIHKHDGTVNYTDLDIVFDTYSKALVEGDFDKFIKLPYTYNYFDNGKPIMNLHRRIYRRFLDENKKFPAPFKTDPGTLYDLFKKKKLLDHAVNSADKITGKNLPGFDKKLKRVNFFARLAKSLMGIRRYSVFARFLRRYFKEENQVFLADKEIGKKLW